MLFIRIYIGSLRQSCSLAAIIQEEEIVRNERFVSKNIVQ